MTFQRRKPAAIGVEATFPRFIEPALATSIEKVPGGDRWLHEIQFDGYRAKSAEGKLRHPFFKGVREDL